MAQVQVANSMRSPSVESLLSRGQSTPTSAMSDTSPSTPADLESVSGKGVEIEQCRLPSTPQQQRLTASATQDSKVTQSGATGSASLTTTTTPSITHARTSLDIAAQLSPGSSEEPLDLVCIGFGPASLTIGIALADKLFSLPPSQRQAPRVQFLEKQPQFAWHAGMQIGGAHMQISFLKDLATPRDPMSPFSFINYLKSQGRLQKFINLGTFLPARKEYEDYMRWCSSHFSKSARYNCEITKVSHNLNPSTGKVDFFTVQWIDHATGQTQEAKTKQVVVATGGRPFVPEQFKPFASGAFPRFMHSSQYITAMNRLDAIRAEPENVRRELEQAMDELTPKSADLEVDSDSLASQLISELSAQVPKKAPGFAKSAEEKEALEKKIVALRSKYTTLRRSLNSLGFSSPKRILVIGGGQSGAEIYCDLLTRFPDAQVCLMLKGAALKPSDDSPFVNEIFDPERVDECYQLDAQKRAENIRRDKDTNYGVVRLELLEKIYMDLYVQQLKEKDESRWPGRVIPNRTVTNVEHKKDGSGVAVTFAKSTDLASGKFAEEEVYEAEMVFYATGYKRDAYKTILADMRGLLPAERDFEVARDYKVKFDESRFEEGRGVWLQGCCEGTHGLSDTLLSILAHRGGQMVDSIFGNSLALSA